jgi:cytoskeletal protein RodZ
LIGEILKRRREESGRDLREISETLKIKYSYLKAIEDGDLENLPAQVYVKGYIHEYAKILGLDPESLVQAYNQETSPPPPEKTIIPEQAPVHKKRFRLRYIIIPSLIVLLAIIAVSVRFPSYQKKVDLPVAPVEEKKETLSEPTTVSSEHTLEIFAADTTWLLVVIDKTDSREMMLQAGDSVKLHAKNCFSLKIGNAGGVRLVFNGKEIGKLGEKGHVIKVDLPDAGI